MMDWKERLDEMQTMAREAKGSAEQAYKFSNAGSYSYEAMLDAQKNHVRVIEMVAFLSELS